MKQSIVEVVSLVRFIFCVQEVYTSEDLSAGSGSAFMNTSLPAYVCVERVLS